MNDVPIWRSHSQIVRDYGASELHRLLVSRGFDLSPFAPQKWAERDSIDGAYWQALDEAEVATLEELAAAAAARKSAA